MKEQLANKKIQPMLRKLYVFYLVCLIPFLCYNKLDRSQLLQKEFVYFVYKRGDYRKNLSPKNIIQSNSTDLRKLHVFNLVCLVFIYARLDQKEIRYCRKNLKNYKVGNV